MDEGYEAYPVADAVGGTSLQAHQAGLDRIAQAGGKPTSVVQVGCELQRDDRICRYCSLGGSYRMLTGVSYPNGAVPGSRQ
jgi:hypothetical protein